MTQAVDRGSKTFTGKRFHALGDDPDEIDIRDIAHALAFNCRFNGHVDRFYSVAEHSLFVYDLYHRLYGTESPQMLLAALLHDASEAYLSDMSAPIKALLPDYKAMEAKVEARIAKKFYLDNLDELVPDSHALIKECDWVALFAESHVLQPKGECETWENYDKYGEMGANFTIWVPQMKPQVAELVFLSAFHHLTNAIVNDIFDAGYTFHDQYVRSIRNYDSRNV